MQKEKTLSIKSQIQMRNKTDLVLRVIIMRILEKEKNIF